MVELEARHSSSEQQANGQMSEVDLNEDGHKSGSKRNSNSNKPSMDSNQASRDSAQAEQLVDSALVEQARQLLRADFEQQPEAYSQLHYDDIMDPKSALTCWRYLSHCGLKPRDAVELMKSALKFRQENQVGLLKASELLKEFWLYAPICGPGKTRDGHDIIYIIGKNYCKPHASLKPTIRKYITKFLFDWDQRHTHDLQKFVLVFDVSDTTYRNIDLDFTAWLITIKDYFPARFESIYVIGVPFLIRPLIRIIMSWLPEAFKPIVRLGTREQLIEPNIDESNLPVEVGGKQAETYRVAPVDASWADESPVYSEAQMEKALEECIGFAVPAERRAKLRAIQLEHEGKLAREQ